jgi:glycine dehydrogenase subunit 1
MNYVPLAESERREMLKALGLASADLLFDALPSELLFPDIPIQPALTEMEAVAELEALATRNQSVQGVPFFLGAGAYRHFIPAAIGALTSRAEFATSYTPYQPEVSQGTLQALFEFQSLICNLTGMEVTNASVYDGATAMAEAALMAMRLTGRGRIVISGSVHPHYREALRAYTAPRGVEIRESWVRPGDDGLIEDDVAAFVDGETACCIVSQPTFFGEIRDLSNVVAAAHEHGALVIEVYNPTSLGLLKPPAAWGVDIAVGEGQPLGVPLSFGGPYVGLMSCRQDLVRQLPGRIVGQAADGEGRRGFVLTLQAREQHIRREKATSNICTSQGLIALMATMYLSLLGPEGMRSVAEACWQTTRYAAEQIGEIRGVKILTPRPFFHEFAISTPLPARGVNLRLAEQGIIGGYDLGRSYPDLADGLLLCCTEMTTREQVDRFAGALAEIVRGAA